MVGFKIHGHGLGVPDMISYCPMGHRSSKVVEGIPTPSVGCPTAPLKDAIRLGKETGPPRIGPAFLQSPVAVGP